MRKKWLFIAPLAILGIVVFMVVGGQVVMHLWNWLLPPLFGWRMITFWQGLGLLALCRILFGGFGRHHGGGAGWRGRMKGRCGSGGLSPEEREKFRQGLRSVWGSEPATGESKG